MLSDVFNYDEMPQGLRIQIVHILNDAVGDDYSNGKNFYRFNFIRDTLCREHERFNLVRNAKNPKDEVIDYFLQQEDVDKVLDVIELAFNTLFAMKVHNFSSKYHVNEGSITPNVAAQELNQRFIQHGIGYQYESGEIIRVDNQLAHKEIIKPALNLLGSDLYKGANHEFLKAHEHYRHSRYAESIIEASKAFESVLKIICDTHGWSYAATDSTMKLLQIIFKNNLLPNFMESQFSAMRGLLESGTSVVRNKLGGHGQGAELVEVPSHMVRYALNTAASNILLLTEASDIKNKPNDNPTQRI